MRTKNPRCCHRGFNNQYDKSFQSTLRTSMPADLIPGAVIDVAYVSHKQAGAC